MSLTTARHTRHVIYCFRDQSETISQVCAAAAAAAAAAALTACSGQWMELLERAAADGPSLSLYATAVSLRKKRRVAGAKVPVGRSCI
jgi:hypothetical protein